MASLDELKLTFFDECDEALQQIESGLTEMRDGRAAPDTVNAVFRAVHSVKGGAGIFGFEALVGFAHTFETVLDAVRRGSLVASEQIVDVLLSAGDVLSDLVQTSRASQPIAPDFGSDCQADLERLIPRSDDADEMGGAPAEDFSDLDFMPVRADEMMDAGGDPASASGDGRLWSVTFEAPAGCLMQDDSILRLIRSLRTMGDLCLSADTARVPSLSTLDPQAAYLAWHGTLRTTSSRGDLEALFARLAPDCRVEIARETDARSSAEEEPAAATVPQPIAVISTPKAEQPVSRGEPVTSAGRPAATTTRIELAKIDRVVNMVGELVIAQAMLSQIAQDLPESITGPLSQTLEQVIHHTRELKDSVMSMRAQPVGVVFERMPRLVRELSAKTGKKVRLEISGEATEIDRSIIERLSDPLTHIIRNSVDHGIEAAPERNAAGKEEEGIIRLSAEHRGGHIVIEIRDDGGGIHAERVLHKARERGLVDRDAVLSDDEINNLIMMPGFSTAEAVSDISGRGVGMDVVRSNIQDIGGKISLKSERGCGMSIQLSLPLTLAVMDGMVIKSGHETYVMPLSTIKECLRPAAADINGLVGTPGMLHLRGDLVPLVRLSDLFGIDGRDDARERVVIIADSGNGTPLGLIVDELCGHQQVVIKSIEESYGPVPGIAAATILGNGRVAFVLDVEKLAALAAPAASKAA